MSAKQRIYARLLAYAIVVVAIDQVTKQAALDYLASGPVHLIDGVLSLRLSYNSGGAFGFLQGIPGLFLIASIVIAAVILVWVGRLNDLGYSAPLGLILGGGLGNLTDRVFRDLEGQVVDFIDLQVWPIFNVADTAIVTGVLLIVFFGSRLSHRDHPE